VEIIKVGTFDDNGMPVGWSISWVGEGGDCPIVDLPASGDVLIGGVLMRELTDERKLSMGKKAKK